VKCCRLLTALDATTATNNQPMCRAGGADEGTAPNWKNECGDFARGAASPCRFTTGLHNMASFILRNPDPELWRAFRERAQSEGRSLRWLILELIRRYVENGLTADELPTAKEMWRRTQKPLGSDD
jgi:hypothetical protein